MQTLHPDDQLPQAADRPPCPLCANSEQIYMFALGNNRLFHCGGCGLVSSDTAQATSKRTSPSDVVTLIELLAPHLQSNSGVIRLALIANISPSSINEVTLNRLSSVDFAGTATSVTNASFGQSKYDAIMVLSQIEFCDDPITFLQTIRPSLTEQGVLVIHSESLRLRERFPKKLSPFTPKWYFDKKTLHLALLKAGFEHVTWEFHGANGILVTARPARVQTAPPLISIVVPVYNEQHTFRELMNQLLAHHISGAEREIIIVESNSTDGTREAATSYAKHPEVRVLFQDGPRGKGNAVREGFAAARGNILMIQDADLEYDLNDYDSLLNPLLTYRELYVLGARHGGNWKMRQFVEQPILAMAMNFGHIFFATLINVLYGQNMKDPFTMYKVFYRDCIWGLDFECNHFDFDHELVIKLALKGYTPLEIPINYVSRSYKEGKKVNLLREPFRWFRVAFKNLPSRFKQR